MKKTTNLNLPVYDTPEVDTFKLNDWNTANETIDYVFGEFKNGATTNAVDITARQDLVNVNSQLADITINVKSFGAKGDGIADDSDAIQSAFNSVARNVGSNRRLLIPKGRYIITKPIITNAIRMYGVDEAIFQLDGENAYIKFIPDVASTLNEHYELSIDNISFSGVNGAKTGLIIQDGSQFYLEKMFLYNFIDYGIEINSSSIGHIIRPTIQGCGVGIHVNGMVSLGVMHANMYKNNADFKFTNWNNSIRIYDSWFEDSATSFLFDDAETFSNVDTLCVEGSSFVRNDAPGGNLITVNATGVHRVSCSNVIMENNRISMRLDGVENVVNCDFTGGQTNSKFVMKAKNNFVLNENYYNGYFAKTIGNTLSQFKIIYEDNVSFGATVNILDGVGRVMGIDRSGVDYDYTNKFRGELVLDNPPYSSNKPGAMMWNAEYKLPRFSNGVEYRYIQGVHNTNTSNRPTQVPAGYCCFDNTINKPIWWNGTVWKDSTGTTV